MKARQVLTALVLLAALVCYGLGLVNSATGLVIAGLGLEVWFWVRLLRRPRQHHPDSV